MQILSADKKHDKSIDLDANSSAMYLDTGSGDADDENVITDDKIFNEIRDEIDRNLSHSSSVHSLISEVSSVTSESGARISEDYTTVPYGFQARAAYEHSKKQTNIMDVCFNGRMRQFVILDGKGITIWKKDAVENPVSRALNYPKYEYRLITTLIYARKYNVYFGLGKDFSLKVLNKDFDETCCVSANLQSVLFMVFNPIKDELITGGVGGTKVWRFHQAADRTWKEIKPMANYILSLKYSLKDVGGSWVKKVELDHVLQHLYCCSDTDLYAYDLDGNQLLKISGAHQMSITGCAYSHYARLLVTSSADADVKVWSINGGHIHTFRGHSRAVTNLVLHPETSSLFLTSSLDGSIRVWSLDTMDIVYSIVVSSEGVRWMGLTDDKLLYIGTSRTISVWSLNNTYHFWALARNPVSSLTLQRGVEDKSIRVLALGNDSSVRLFARNSHKNLSTVLPPPPISPLQSVLAFCYSRRFNVVYLLVNHHDIWLYTTRTDPACRIAVWNVHELQEPRTKQTQADDTMSSMVNSNLAVHRATENGYGNEVISDCCSLCQLESAAVVFTDEGPVTPLKRSFLLLGLEDGRILFMDPVVKGMKYLEFRANKDAILQIEHDVKHDCLITACNMKSVTMIQIWSLPQLQLQHDVYCAQDVVSFCRLGMNFLTGHKSGGVIHHQLVPTEDPGPIRPKVAAPNVEQISPDSLKADHRAPILSVDACAERGIFCSASCDGAIKIWLSDKTLLTEITMDATLTSICFFNNRGDILIGMKNHIFIIECSKTCPSLIVEEDECEEQFETESEIYEDPAVVFEGVSENPDAVDIDSYLIPFNMEFSQDFIEGRTAFKQSDNEEDVESETESELSMAPTEIYLSPRETPKMSGIDLTLSSDILSGDLKEQMKLTEKLEGKKKRVQPISVSDVSNMVKQEEESRMEYPVFGISPGPTPTTSVPPTPSVTSEVEHLSEDEETEVDEDKDESKSPRQRSQLEADVQIIRDKEGRVIDNKLKKVSSPVSTVTDDRLSKLKSFTVDAKALMAEEAKKKQQEAPPMSPVRTDIMVSFVPPGEKLPDKTVKREVRKKMQTSDRKLPKKAEKQRSKPPVPKMTEEQKKGARWGEMYGRAPVSMARKGRVRASITNIPALPASLKEEDSSSLSEAPDLKEKRTATTARKPAVDIKPRRVGAAASAGVKSEPVPAKPTNNNKTPNGGRTQMMFFDKKRNSSVQLASGQSSTVTFDDTPQVIVTEKVSGDVLLDETDAVKTEKTDLNIAPQLAQDVVTQSKETIDTSTEQESLSPSPEQPALGHLTRVSTTRHPKKTDRLSFRLPTRSRSYSSNRDNGGLSMDIEVDIDDYDDGGNFTDDEEKNDDDDDVLAAQLLAERPFTSDETRRRPRFTLSAKSGFRPHTAPASVSDSQKDLKTMFDELVTKFRNSGWPLDKLLRNDGTHFDNNWADRMIERHMLLKMQKELRIQSAAEKRHLLEIQRKQRRKALLGHHDCDAQSPISSGYLTRSESSFFGRDRAMTAPAGPLPSTPLPGVTNRPPIQPKSAFIEQKEKEKQDLGAEMPFRYRLNQDPHYYNVRHLKSYESHIDAKMMDPRHPSSHAFRPVSSRSIPSKCSHYVLVTQPKSTHKIIPSPLEEQLINDRFPQLQHRWLTPRKHKSQFHFT
ncbi:uncharacterized protein LOC141901337 [Tubulanus polymorphus]|uniref:uncharacterized protein LOC141901337 n=1 Tax=Tubulanus polymorphus TaxID=672921 RepID=UPI003DA39A42